MAIGCCNNAGLVLAAVAALLLLPPPFLKPASPPAPAPPSSVTRTWAELVEDLSALDLFLTLTLIFFGAFTFLAEFVQRKLMERRIAKLNSYLSSSVSRLQAWDTQQSQLEGTLTMVQRATSEYTLLLYLLLSQRRYTRPQTSDVDTLFDKGLLNHEFGLLA